MNLVVLFFSLSLVLFVCLFFVLFFVFVFLLDLLRLMSSRSEYNASTIKYLLVFFCFVFYTST